MEFTLGGLATVILEFFKWVWRRFVIKDINYDFPANFYKVAIPTLNVLLLPFAAWLVPGLYEMPTDLQTFARLVLLTIINSLVSILAYNAGLKPTKQAFREKQANT